MSTTRSEGPSAAAAAAASTQQQPAVLFRGKRPYKMLGPYLMGNQLGEGTQGKVREAVHSASLRRVAVKIVNMRLLARSKKQADEMMAREVQIHRALKHPNVIELIDDFRLDDRAKWYVVMELAIGASLQDVIDSLPSPMAEHLARHLMRQLFRALDYCHSQSVVHRDVKPSNMLVSIGGTLRLCDFGVAERLSPFETGLCSKSRGSPAFQPPEVASGDEIFCGFKVDAWAAGISLFVLITGAVPFGGASLIQLFENIARGEYGEPEAIRTNPPLLALSRGLLTVDQNERLSVGEALRQPWLSDHAASGSAGWDVGGRELVASVASAAPRIASVLRSIARMYGEESVPEEGAEDEDERIEAHPLGEELSIAAGHPGGRGGAAAKPPMMQRAESLPVSGSVANDAARSGAGAGVLLRQRSADSLPPRAGSKDDVCGIS